MFHVRQSRRQRLPCVHRTNARRRSAPEGAGRARPEAVLLPPDDPLPRGTHRRSIAVRLRSPAAAAPDGGEGFLGPQSFESFRRVRGVAWFERGGLRSSRSQEILPAWGAGDSGSNPDGPTFPPGGGCHSGRREETNAPESSLVPGPDRRNTTLMRRSAIATAVGWNHGTRQTQQGGSRTEPEHPGTPRSWIEPESSEHDVLGDRL